MGKRLPGIEVEVGRGDNAQNTLEPNRLSDVRRGGSRITHTEQHTGQQNKLPQRGEVQKSQGQPRRTSFSENARKEETAEPESQKPMQTVKGKSATHHFRSQQPVQTSNAKTKRSTKRSSFFFVSVSCSAKLNADL